MDTLNAQLDQLNARMQVKLSEALTSLAHVPVNVTIHHGNTLPLAEARSLLPWPDEQVTTVYIPVMGDMTGDIFLLLPIRSANAMADLMVGNAQGTTNIIQGVEASAIQELGNILTGVVVTEMADTFKLSIMLTVPNLATGMASALIDQALISYGAVSDSLFGLTFPFKIGENGVEGAFLILFDTESLHTLEKNANGAS